MRAWWLVAWLVSVTAAADFDTYVFRTPEQETRYRALVNELRCVVCQGQTLSGSNADVAKNMRRKVYEQISAGRTDEEITQYMVERYSDFVLYDPPVKTYTLLLWGGPLLFLLMGLAVAWRVARGRDDGDDSGPGSSRNRDRARRLLDEDA